MLQRQVRNYKKVLNNVADHVKEAQYAVRGAIPIRGQEITNQLRRGEGSYDFEETAYLNIGNPQQVGQNVLSFNREVLAGMLYPKLITQGGISKDAEKRIERYKTHQQSPVGAYTTNSKGWTYVREAVADFISKRDGVRTDWERVYLTNGASEGIRILMSMLVRDNNDGILCPIPQYPLYSALITMNRAHLLPYYLDEDKNWGLDADSLIQ
jgi:alanine transaminase